MTVSTANTTSMACIPVGRVRTAAGSIVRIFAPERPNGRHAAKPGLGYASRIRAAGIRIKQLLAVDLVAGDRILALRRNQPVDELLSQPRLHGRMLLRIDQHHAVLIEQPL